MHRDQQSPADILRAAFDWDAPEYKDRHAYNRIKVNPMTGPQIFKTCVGEDVRQLPRDWADALRTLTGQQKPVHTTLVVGGRTLHGKFWKMPPSRLKPNNT